MNIMKSYNSQTIKLTNIYKIYDGEILLNHLQLLREWNKGK